jgi:ABC-2 type transport system ATP-binding protein
MMRHKDKSNSVATDSAALPLKSCNLQIGYQSKGKARVLLDQVHLSVKSGEMVTVEGPAECGKSLFLHTLAGVRRPLGGSAHIFGIDSSKGPRSFAPLVSLVTQRDSLFPHLTIKENLCYLHALAGLSADNRLIEETINSLALANSTAMSYGKCSRGIRRKAAVAAALIRQPRLIIADAPFAEITDNDREIVAAALANFVTAGGTLVCSDGKPYLESGRNLLIQNGLLQ